MKQQSIKRQTIVTTVCNIVIRGMGFFMRLWISKELGAEAVGVMELASGAHMMALTPASSGLPGAVSRMTARAEKEDQKMILFAGRQMAVRMALLLSPLFFFLSPLIASWLGDTRTLPSLMIFAPCVLFVGASGAYDGYCYGIGNAWPPCMSEMIEQVARMALTFFLLTRSSHLTVAGRAALPALASTVGEGVGLILSIVWVGRIPSFRRDSRLKGIKKKIWRLSLPLMANRLSHTALRTLSGAMIPARLTAAGLSAGEAVSRLGMLNGMVMPLLFLPGMLAGALGTVGGPAAARCKNRKEENRLGLRLLVPALAAGVGCGGMLYILAPWISRTLYRLPELAPLIRALCPMAVLLPLQQVLSGLMAGLGLQRKSFRASLIGACVTLLFTYLWTAAPALHIYGAGFASMLGHGLTLILCGISFWMR